MEKIIINKSSHKSLKEIYNLYNDDFKEIKKITTYFDQANFLFDEYEIVDTSVNMIIENFNGQLIYVSGLNCGYYGEGPRTTQELLMKIGFSKEKSYRLILNKALRIEFVEKGNINTAKIESNSIFEYKHLNTLEEEMKRYDRKKDRSNIIKYYIQDETKIDLINRKVYICNPQISKLTGLFILIDLLNVKKVSYYLGDKSKLENSLRADELFMNWNRNFDYNARSVNLVIEGDLFSIVCFINSDSQIDVISSVYYKIFGISLYEKIFLKDTQILLESNISKIKLALKIIRSLFNNEKVEIYGDKEVDINDEVGFYGR
ncbi:MAG: hypothetical protein ACLS9F_17690 [Clostridium paraputrificum]